MALTQVDLGGTPEMVGLNGVYRGQTQPELLGLKSLSLKLRYFYIGLDTRVRPTVVRIFFDPPNWDLQSTPCPYTSIALLQIGRITYQGVPIRPDTFGMGLEHLSAYNYSNFFDLGNQNYWVDMMDVTKMQQMSATLGYLNPLFAYNGFLRNPNYTLDQFFTYPMPNGSIASIPPKDGANIALCASLSDAIDFDLDVPPADVITNMVKRMQANRITPVKTSVFQHSQVQSTGPLQLALNLLEITDASTIDEIQVAGPHMIITVKDIEAENPIFIAFFDGSQETANSSTMLIYKVDEDELDQLRFKALTETFTEIKNSFITNSLLGEAGFPLLDPPPPARGNKGLNPFPFKFTKDTDPEIAFTYHTLPVGLKDNKITFCYGGLKWRVSREFDSDTLEFGPLRIEKPWFRYGPSLSVNAFLRGIRRPKENFVVPVVQQYDQALRGFSSFNTTNPYLYEDNKQAITPNNPAFGDGTQTWSEE